MLAYGHFKSVPTRQDGQISAQDIAGSNLFCDGYGSLG